MNAFLLVINAISLVIILSFLCSWLWSKCQAKRVGGTLSNEEFRASIRKAQVIDVREGASFKRKHIDRACNIPMTMFRYRHGEIRKDLPVYLYSSASSITLHAARTLQKDSYKKIFRLEGGSENWDGRTRASKY